jgi:hypothetical protein
MILAMPSGGGHHQQLLQASYPAELPGEGVLVLSAAGCCSRRMKVLAASLLTKPAVAEAPPSI